MRYFCSSDEEEFPEPVRNHTAGCTPRCSIARGQAVRANPRSGPSVCVDPTLTTTALGFLNYCVQEAIHLGDRVSCDVAFCRCATNGTLRMKKSFSQNSELLPEPININKFHAASSGASVTRRRLRCRGMTESRSSSPSCTGIVILFNSCSESSRS